jgi:hypothetical protein
MDIFNLTDKPKLNGTKLVYWRCADCLRTFTVESSVHPEVCSCGGKPERMGAVYGEKHYGHTEIHCACDERCTHATGPNCSCSCGGINHGTGAVVEITVFDGKVRVTTPNAAKEQERADEWRVALERAEKHIDATYCEPIAKIRTGVWIDHETWSRTRAATSTLAKAKGMRQHAARMKALEQLYK